MRTNVINDNRGISPLDRGGFPLKKLCGYLAAAVFAGISYVLSLYGKQFSQLVDMVYPYVIRTLEETLAAWSSQVDFLLWQFLAVALLVVVIAWLVVVIVTKKSVFQWFGWVLAIGSFLFMLHTFVYGMNYYAGDLADDLRMEVSGCTLDEIVEATEYYQSQANAMAAMMDRDGSGSLVSEEFNTLAARAGKGFDYLTYQRFFPVFAGSTLPVKKLGWADLYSSMGITGITFPLTGEAAVNPQIPAAALPFTICHEMAHRMCIALERDANFAAFLACSFNNNRQYQYSAYFMAYRYCYTALYSVGQSTSIDPQLVMKAASEARRIDGNVNSQLRRDMDDYDGFFRSRKNSLATSLADTFNDAYLKASGDSAGTASYGQVCDLLVNWHIQEVVLPALIVEENRFDPYDETQVDLSGIVNARGY